MGSELDKFRRNVCQREGHTHGEAGELDCLLLTLLRYTRPAVPPPEDDRPPSPT
ncbi:MAG TPA: hypothetical protein VFH78_06975 [Candidatus Thermoplasmatota archaeon]|nr:hypothetical protein [Candidatus Thermoplasmatota archaeon]